MEEDERGKRADRITSVMKAAAALVTAIAALITAIKL